MRGMDRVRGRDWERGKVLVQITLVHNVFKT